MLRIAMKKSVRQYLFARPSMPISPCNSFDKWGIPSPKSGRNLQSVSPKHFCLSDYIISGNRDMANKGRLMTFSLLEYGAMEVRMTVCGAYLLMNSPKSTHYQWNTQEESHFCDELVIPFVNPNWLSVAASQSAGEQSAISIRSGPLCSEWVLHCSFQETYSYRLGHR